MNKIINTFEKGIDNLQVVLLSVIVISIGMQIFSRTLFSRPLEFPEELSVFFLIAIVFLGVVIVEKDNDQLKVEIIFNLLPQKTHKYFILLSKMLTIILVVFVILGELKIWPKIVNLKTTAAKIPYTWIHGVMIASCILWLIILVYTSFKTITDKEEI